MTTLRIEQTRIAADRFRADVELHTDDGRRRDVSGEFPFTMTDADHADLRWYLEDYLSSPFEPEQKMAGRIEARMHEIGEELFNALFTSQDGQFLWGSIRADLDRVRVEIASDIQDATTVPWELLREPNAESPLAVAVREFVRSHTHTKQTALQARHDDLPIRVLLVICRPGKNRDVPFRSVASRLVKALTDDARPLLRLDVLRPATFDRLAEVLRQAHTDGKPYHVVHFDGHGAFLDLEEVIQRWEEAGGDMPRELADVLDVDPQRFSPKTVYPHTPAPGRHGYLVFENPIAATNTRLTDGGEIGRLLVETQVPVLVLNACRSAHAEVEQADEQKSDNQPDSSAVPSVPADPTVHEQVRAFGSLAHQVSHEGVSGVVAMRYNVYVVTAAEFVADLYAELVQGRSLGQAATLARKGLADDPLRTIAYDPVPLEDWPVPVVFESFPIRLFPAKEDRPKLNLRISSSRSAEAGSLDPALPKPPDVGFFGRDETLLELDRSFDTQQVVLLHAFAGSGKTQAAAEFARWYALTGGVAGPVLFTSFETYRPLARVLDRIGEVFGQALEQSRINWLALDDDQRRDMALQVFKQIPVLWIWDNVEPIAGFPSTQTRSASERDASERDASEASTSDGGAPPPSQQSPDPKSPDVPRSRVGLGSDTVYTSEKQQELVNFLRDAAGTKARFLLTSRRDERSWLADLPRRIPVGPMPMHERVQLAQALAEKQGKSIQAADWRPLLRFTDGNPLTLTVVVGQALRDGLQTPREIESFVERLRRGEAAFTDESQQGRSRSLGASLSYGFDHAFTEPQRRTLALLHLFQGFVDVRVLQVMGNPDDDWSLAELRGETRESLTGLLDRAAEVGLLTAHGGGYYSIHPALPWFFKSMFDASYVDRSYARQSVEDAADPPSGDGSYIEATRAFVEAVGELGNYYHDENERGNRDVIAMLGAEEANLLHARRLARQHGWWPRVLSATQGLRLLYEHTGRRAEWSRLVEEMVPDFVDPATDGPLPGQKRHYWSLVTEYRVGLAKEQRDWPRAERLQRVRVDWDRRQVEKILECGDSLPHSELLARLRPRLDGLSDADRNTIRTLWASLHAFGDIQREQNNADCVTAYREALDLAELLSLRTEAASAALDLGNAYHGVSDLRDLDQAEHWYRRSLDLREKHDRVVEARSQAQLGAVAFERFREARTAGRAEAELLKARNAALAEYQQALELLPETAVNDLAIAHNALGAIYVETGDIDRALPHFRECIRLRESAGNLYGVGTTRFNVAVGLAQAGKLSDAREYARAALKNFEPYGPGAADMTAQTQQLLAEIEQALAPGS